MKISRIQQKALIYCGFSLRLKFSAVLRPLNQTQSRLYKIDKPNSCCTLQCRKKRGVLKTISDFGQDARLHNEHFSEITCTTACEIYFFLFLTRTPTAKYSRFEGKPHQKRVDFCIKIGANLASYLLLERKNNAKTRKYEKKRHTIAIPRPH